MRYQSQWVRVLVAAALSTQLLFLTSCDQPKQAAAPESASEKQHKFPPPCQTFDSLNSPVKGCCGSMTFHSVNDWTRVATAPAESYCTNIPKQDTYSVALDDTNQPFASLTGAWTVTVNSYQPGSKSYGASKEGVQLKANPDHGCDPSDTTHMSVTISPLTLHPDRSAKVGFYANDGPQSKGYGHNRRFRDEASYAEYDCKQDRDLCERIGSVTANGSTTKKCTDAQCSFFILK